jgi:hypothetical protein
MMSQKRANNAEFRVWAKATAKIRKACLIFSAQQQ